MDGEFHYYITGIIARRAGFSEEDAMIIAHSSKLVDDNTTVFTVKDKDGEEYSNYISQTYNILKPRKTLMRIYSIFHFIPGNPMATSARRRDGKMHILNTTPDNGLSRYAIYKAFNSPVEKKLYSIGIATHSYADTWSHQNFVGFNDDFNGLMNPIPNIGHADAMLNPDKVNEKWWDKRLVKSRIKNNDRFISAAENMFYKYRNYLRTTVSWGPLKEKLLFIMENFNRKKREELYVKLEPWLIPYNEQDWFEKAIDCKVNGLKDYRSKFIPEFAIMKDDYFWKNGIKKEDTCWFKFQEAVKDHQATMLPLINNRYKSMGVDIRSF